MQYPSKQRLNVSQDIKFTMEIEDNTYVRFISTYFHIENKFVLCKKETVD